MSDPTTAAGKALLVTFLSMYEDPAWHAAAEFDIAAIEAEAAATERARIARIVMEDVGIDHPVSRPLLYVNGFADAVAAVLAAIEGESK